MTPRIFYDENGAQLEPISQKEAEELMEATLAEKEQLLRALATIIGLNEELNQIRESRCGD